MHIILVSNRLTTAKTITLTPRKLLLAGLLFFGLILALSSLFSYLTLRHAATLRLPVLQDMLRTVNIEESQRSYEYLKAMAIKLGDMQAQLTRLDSLGERLARMTGARLPDAQPEGGGRGGPLLGGAALAPSDLQRELEVLTRQVELRTDTLSLLESLVFERRLRQKFLPSSLPIDSQWNASAFGWRIDPFTGVRAMHEGVDFPTEAGTPIVASAAGVVSVAEYHPEYGNMVEIDHGNGLTTRYAHASRLLVSVGAVVKRDQRIALVGNTGRSTGPHLHFEVRYRGAAQNPNRFLLQARANTLAQH
ncbi:M23 family metallopeptidase [Denitratisoma oestradiolicum]|uniref:Putative peptidase n=1 Tax=Denitratisoma oestradiolicum TaxID=311182 RepID=A0A6S6Y4E8_9PROT|nr:M23 family metallopeptidase [Denitratisoma oestradiolicum]TWO80419.1 hypothetical protein CBW56_09965 [Denitratisoma oestradiolicum]CAB1370230.1 putative peptidase [Denitratisoma oestradiolicum]